MMETVNERLEDLFHNVQANSIAIANMKKNQEHHRKQEEDLLSVSQPEATLQTGLQSPMKTQVENQERGQGEDLPMPQKSCIHYEQSRALGEIIRIKKQLGEIIGVKKQICELTEIKKQIRELNGIKKQIQSDDKAIFDPGGGTVGSILKIENLQENLQVKYLFSLVFLSLLCRAVENRWKLIAEMVEGDSRAIFLVVFFNGKQEFNLVDCKRPRSSMEVSRKISITAKVNLAAIPKIAPQNSPITKKDYRNCRFNKGGGNYRNCRFNKGG